MSTSASPTASRTRWYLATLTASIGRGWAAGLSVAVIRTSATEIVVSTGGIAFSATVVLHPSDPRVQLVADECGPIPVGRDLARRLS